MYNQPGKSGSSGSGGGTDVSALAKEATLQQVRDTIATQVTLANVLSQLGTMTAKLQDIFGAVDGLEISADNIAINADDIDLNTNELEEISRQIRDRLPSIIGRLARAGSMSVTLSEEDGALLGSVKTNTDKLDIALSTLRDQLLGGGARDLTAIYNALHETLDIAGVVDTGLDEVMGEIRDALGDAGTAPPALATGASGVIGWLRKVWQALSDGVPALLKIGGVDVGPSNPMPITGTVVSTGAELTVEVAMAVAGFNLQAAAFSETTAIGNDYVLEYIDLKFSTAEPRNITITSASGFIIHSETANAELRLQFEEIAKPFNSGDQITVTVSQTTGPCSLSLELKIMRGALPLTGDPSIGAFSPLYYSAAPTGVGVALGPLEMGSKGFISVHLRGTFSATMVVEGTNDPAGLANWTAQRVESVSGLTTSSMRNAGVYFIPTVTRWSRIRCSQFTSGAPLLDVLVSPQARPSFSKDIRDKDGLASWALGTFGTGIIATRTFLAGGDLDTEELDEEVWLSLNENGGAHTFGTGGLVLGSGTAANGRAGIRSKRNADFLGANDNEITIVMANGDTGVDNAGTRWGVYDDDDGAFAELTASGISFHTRKGGVDTVSPLGTLGIVAPTLSSAFSFWTITFNPNLLIFRQNGNFVQIFLGSASLSTLFNRFDLPITVEVFNAGNTTNRTATVVSAVANRFGEQATVRADQSFKADDVLDGVGAILHARRFNNILGRKVFDQVQLAEHAVDKSNLQPGALSNGASVVFTADATANTLQSVAHGLVDGDPVVLSTTGAFPVPLTNSYLDAEGDSHEVVYWVVNKTTDDFQLAATRGGAVIDLTDVGTGVHHYQKRGYFLGTFVDVSQVGSMLPIFLSPVAPAMVQLQWSPDGDDQGTNIFDVSDIPMDNLSGFYIGYVPSNTMVDQYYRALVVCGPINQIAPYSIFETFIGKNAYVGSFGGLNAPLSPISSALLTRSVQAGYNADDGFTNARISSRHRLGSTNIPLPGNTGGTAHKWRGKWLRWQGNFGGLVGTINANVSGTSFLQFSQRDTPTEGVAGDSDGSVTDASDAVVYNPATTPLLPSHITVRSKWVRAAYDNGDAAQAEFNYEISYLSQAAVQPAALLSSTPTSRNMGTMGQDISIIEKQEFDAVAPYEKLKGTINPDTAKRGANSHLTGQDYETPVRPRNRRKTGQVVCSTTPELIPLPDFVPKSLRLQNMSSLVDVFYGAAGVSINTGDAIHTRSSITEEFGKHRAGDPIDATYVVADTSSLIPAVANRFGTNAPTNVVGVTNAANMNADDASFATYSAVGQTADLTGFAVPGTKPVIQKVEIIAKVFKDSTPTKETAAHVATVGKLFGNLGQLITDTLVFEPTHTYFVGIMRRNTAAAFTSFANTMGFTGATLVDQRTGGSERIDVYRMTGTPTQAGTITVNLSALATTAIVTVTRVDKLLTTADPMQNHEVIGGASAAYSDSIVGQAKGIAITWTCAVNVNHTAGSGFTEQFDQKTSGGGGANETGVSVNTLQLVADGAQAYSGPFSGNADNSVVAATFYAADAVNPVLVIPYLVSTVQGPQFFSEEISSTVEALYAKNITGDRAWTAADVVATTLRPNVTTIGVAVLKAQAVGFRFTEVDAAGNIVVTYRWLGVDA